MDPSLTLKSMPLKREIFFLKHVESLDVVFRQRDPSPEKKLDANAVSDLSAI
jgi:hypothetical protein